MSTNGKPALLGGEPVRKEMLPYGRQWIDEDDVRAVAEALRGDLITSGPLVERYERKFAETVGARFGTAVNSGTAALHAALNAVGVGEGDEVVTTPLTFAASANCILYCGARPVFADVDRCSLNIDPGQVERRITPRTRAVLAVDFTGRPCDYGVLRETTERHGIPIVEDAAHALGAAWNGRPVGSINEITCFSTHPVKHVTTAEGGMAVTDDPVLAGRMRNFRNHGITVDFRERERRGGWLYDIESIGYNYRIPDVLCALGMSQMDKLPGWLERRREIARRYDEAFGEMEGLWTVPEERAGESARHIYVVLLEPERLDADRAEIFRALRAEGIGVNVHYIPVYFHSAYARLGYERGLCPVAESVYERMLTLPLFPRMSDRDVEDVIRAVRKVIGYYLKG